MTSIFESDAQRFDVVVNEEKQYSIWPERWDVPVGWRTIGVSGQRADCLRHIESVWIDLRPASLIRKMNGHATL